MIIFDYNSFMIKKLNTKTKEKQCVNKSDISVFINDSELKIKIERLTKKAELKSEKDKIRQLETYDLSNFLKIFLVMLVFKTYMFVILHLLHQR